MCQAIALCSSRVRLGLEGGPVGALEIWSTAWATIESEMRAYSVDAPHLIADNRLRNGGNIVAHITGGSIVGLGLSALLVLPAAAAAQSSTKTYEYDALGRLVKVETNGGQENDTRREYEYDPAGNRLSVDSTKDADNDGVNGQVGAGKNRIMFNGIFVVQRKQ